MRPRQRQTEGISCHEKQNRGRRSLSLFSLSFTKGNTSQEIMGWVGTAGETRGAKISSAIQTQCVSNLANFLWLLGEQRQCWLNMGLIRKQDTFTLLLPFLFSSPPFFLSIPLVSHSICGPPFICLPLSNFLSCCIPASLFPPIQFLCHLYVSGLKMFLY